MGGTSDYNNKMKEMRERPKGCSDDKTRGGERIRFVGHKTFLKRTK